MLIDLMSVRVKSASDNNRNSEVCCSIIGELDEKKSKKSFNQFDMAIHVQNEKNKIKQKGIITIQNIKKKLI